MDYNIGLIEELPVGIHERVNTLLVYTRVKPATIYDIRYMHIDQGKEYHFLNHTKEEVERLEANLTRMQIPYKFQKKKMRLSQKRSIDTTSLCLGSTQENLALLLGAKTDEERGRAYGFPRTAIEAYLGIRPRYDNHYPADIAPELIAIAQYIKSAEFWREELKVAEQWLKQLRTNSFRLYHQFSSHSMEQYSALPA